MKKLLITTCKDVLLVDYFLLSSDVFPAIKYFDILDYNTLFSDVHSWLSVYLHTNVNKNTTIQDIGHGSNSIHIKWNTAKQNEFVQSICNNETAFGEFDYILSEQCEGNQAKEIVNNSC